MVRLVRAHCLACPWGCSGSPGGSNKSHGFDGFFRVATFRSRRNATAKTRPAQEKCELCSVRLGPDHRHLLETRTRKIVCTCNACAMRFEGVLDGRFKIIPRDARALPDFKINDAEWERLSLPINLAFFFYNTPNEKMVAMYPSPAGATESLLPLTAWDSLVRQNPALNEMQPDVEALLVNRTKNSSIRSGNAKQ